MEQKNDFLGKEPVGKLLLRLSLPAIAAQIVNLLYNMVDRIYIGHMPEVGDLALTGVGVCMSVIMIVSAFAAFVGSGAAHVLRWQWDAGTMRRQRKFWATASVYSC